MVYFVKYNMYIHHPLPASRASTDSLCYMPVRVLEVPSGRVQEVDLYDYYCQLKNRVMPYWTSFPKINPPPPPLRPFCLLNS